MIRVSIRRLLLVIPLLLLLPPGVECEGEPIVPAEVASSYPIPFPERQTVVVALRTDIPEAHCSSIDSLGCTMLYPEIRMQFKASDMEMATSPRLSFEIRQWMLREGYSLMSGRCYPFAEAPERPHLKAAQALTTETLSLQNTPMNRDLLAAWNRQKVQPKAVSLYFRTEQGPCFHLLE